MEHPLPYDPSGGKASYWLDKAASALDCAVQCAHNQAASNEYDELERKCDELADAARKAYN